MVCETPDGAGECRSVYRALFVRRRAMRRVSEGGARLAVASALNGKPGATSGFFNYNMHINREVCLHELTAALADGPWRARGSIAGGADTQADDDRGDDEGGRGIGAEGQDVRVLDAFAATGALAIRVAVEGATAAARAHSAHDAARHIRVTAADLDGRCIHLARTSADLSGVQATSIRAALLPSGVDGDSSIATGAAGASAASTTRKPIHTMAVLMAADEAYGSLSIEPSPSVQPVDAAVDGDVVTPPAAAPPAAQPTHSSPASLQLAHADARALVFLEPTAFDYSHLDPFGSCAPYLDPFLARCPHGGLVSLTATDTSTLYAHYPNVGRRLYAAELLRGDGCWREVGVRALCAAVATTAARHTRGIRVLHATTAAHFVHILVRVKRGASAADASAKLVHTLTTPDGTTLGPMWAGALNAPRFLSGCVAAAAAAAARPGAPRSDTAAATSAQSLFQRSHDDPGMPPFSVPTGQLSPSLLVDKLRARGFYACISAFDGDAAKPHGSKRVRTDAPSEVLHELGVRVPGRRA